MYQDAFKKFSEFKLKDLLEPLKVLNKDKTSQLKIESLRLKKEQLQKEIEDIRRRLSERKVRLLLRVLDDKQQELNNLDQDYENKFTLLDLAITELFRNSEHFQNALHGDNVGNFLRWLWNYDCASYAKIYALISEQFGLDLLKKYFPILEVFKLSDYKVLIKKFETGCYPITASSCD